MKKADSAVSAPAGLVDLASARVGGTAGQRRALTEGRRAGGLDERALEAARYGPRSPRASASDILAAMALPGRRSAVVWFALVVAAWTVFALLSGVETGLLYLAPALLLCVPLLFGRYVGEEQLAQV